MRAHVFHNAAQRLLEIIGIGDKESAGIFRQLGQCGLQVGGSETVLQVVVCQQRRNTGHILYTPVGAVCKPLMIPAPACCAEEVVRPFTSMA